MRYYSIPFCFIIFIFGCQISQDHQNEEDPKRFFMPAEYEKQEAVWLGYTGFVPYEEPFMRIAGALGDKVPLKMIVADSVALTQLKAKLIDNGLDPSLIIFYLMEDNRLWMRDHGATYVINEQGEKKVVDFGWTLYGNQDFLASYYEGNQDSIAHYYQRNLGKTGLVDSLMGVMDGWSSLKTDVNMEGGSIEVNGKGTLILCESVTMQRNPDLKKEYIESEFKRVLGVTNIIWMKKGLVEDPFWFNEMIDGYYGWGTNGHTDEFVRFANDSTILLAWIDEDEKDLHEFNQINYERMTENLSILEESTDQDGKPFHIIRVPLPDPLYMKVKVAKDEEGIDWLERKNWKASANWFPKKNMEKVGDEIYWVGASSYLNYLVTNDVVLLPTYINEGSSIEKENRVMEIFSRVFPDRGLVFLDVMNLNYFGGGIHCVTQQEPSVRAPLVRKY